MVSSKNEICNMGLSLQGNYGTVTDIDTPRNDKEKAYAKWYPTCLDMALKLVMPNFALAREIVAQDLTTPAFGYAYRYAKPSGCLKVLGIGNVDEKQNNYAVEGQWIISDEDYEDGMEVRYIQRITDVAQYTPEFVLMFAKHLAAYTAMEVTQDAGKAKLFMDALPTEMSIASGLNAQENRPTRISNSRFKGARYVDNPNYTNKK